MFILGYFLIWNYNTCLSVEVFIKIKKITNQSYSRRRKAYHLLSWASAALLTALIGVYQSYGRTSYDCCFVKKDSFGHYFEIIPIGFNFPLILTFSILSVKNASKSFEPLMVGLTISNLLLAFTLTISNLLTFFDKFNWVSQLEMNVGAAIGACSGIVVSGSRLLSKSLYMKVKKTWRQSSKKFVLDEFRRESQYDESSDINFYKSNIWNLSMFFDNLTKKTVAEILITLFIRFKYEKLESFNKKFVISYTKDRYERLSSIIPIIKHCNFQVVYKDESVIVEYYPHTFDSIRKRIGITPESLCESLIDSENFTQIKVEDTNKGGQSGSFFFKTSNGHFILKTIKRTERKTFIKRMLNPYAEHIANKNSKLVRILGVFKALPCDLDFIIMENIIPFDIEMSVFDLKGYSNKNRIGTSSTKKDSQFIEEFEPIENSTKTEIIRNLREDLSFLRGLEIMDYSVLIADFHLPYKITSKYLARDSPRPLIIGIIDYFQEYNLKKTAEYRLKSLFSKDEISCVEPGKYYIRLLNFLVKYL